MPPDENQTEPAPVETVPQPSLEVMADKAEPIPPEDGHQGEVVDIKPSENVTEVHTPETVSITEVMPNAEPAQSPTLGKEFLKSLLPKMKEKLAFRTEKRLSKILELAREKGEIRNDDVERELKVSDSSAARYLKKLVDRGQLKKTGDPEWPRYEPN